MFAIKFNLSALLVITRNDTLLLLRYLQYVQALFLRVVSHAHCPVVILDDQRLFDRAGRRPHDASHLIRAQRRRHWQFLKRPDMIGTRDRDTR